VRTSYWIGAVAEVLTFGFLPSSFEVAVAW